MGSTTSATVLISGGLDSAACALWLKSRGYSVTGVFVDFGQSAVAAEQAASERVGARLGISMTTIRATGAPNLGVGELVGRNAFFIFAALLLAPVRSGILGLGVHAGTTYYDCSPAFLTSMQKVVSEHTNGTVSLVAPFIEWSKIEIFRYLNTTGFDPALTYSCEKGTQPVCGVCASCQDRGMLGC